MRPKTEVLVRLLNQASLLLLELEDENACTTAALVKIKLALGFKEEVELNTLLETIDEMKKEIQEGART